MGRRGVLSEDEVEHVRSALASAPMRNDPSPYVLAEPVFSDAFYQKLLAEFPSDEGAFVRWNHGGDPAVFFGNYDRRLEVNIPEGLGRLTESQRAFWSAMSGFLCGPVFAGMLISTFRKVLLERFGEELESPSFFEQRMRGAMMLNKHDPEYCGRRRLKMLLLFFMRSGRG